MRKPITIKRNILHAQSKGCWLFLQIRYTAIYFHDLWGNSDGVGLRVDLNAPLKGHEARDLTISYPLGRWGIGPWKYIAPLGIWKRTGRKHTA